MFKQYAVIALTLCSTQVIAQASKTVIGEAFDTQSNELLYVEKHRYVQGDKHEVKYYDPQGELFAQKLLSYGDYEQAPEFEQTNDLRGEWIRVTEQGSKIKVEYRETSDAVVFDKRFDVSDDLLVDAGFDRYVKKHWNELVNLKQKRSIDYLVPSRLTTVGFDVSKVDCLAGTVEPAVCFQIAPTSWWVSLAVDPITVAYDPDSHNLLRFNGRGNIASASGSYQTVDIHYQYPNAE